MKNILVLTYWSYKDALIQTYTLPYVRIIRSTLPASSKIFLFTLEQVHFNMSDEEWESEKNELAKENIFIIRFNYDHFGLKMTFKLIGLVFYLKKLIKNENINYLHSWCMTAGALGYLLSVLTKKPLIIDSYEPHAEAMVENGTWNKSSFKFKLLHWLEKKQSHRSNTVIALTNGMKDYAITKFKAQFKNYFVKPALVNLEKFKWDTTSYQQKRTERGLGDKIVMVYAGKLGGIYLNEEVFDLFKIAHNYWGEKLKIYLLTDKDPNEIKKLIQLKAIPKGVIEHKFVSHHEIVDYLQIADFAINPVKPVPTKRYCTSIKDGEYWAMGLPVIITKNISDDSEIIKNENIGYVLNELNDDEYIFACKKIDALLDENQETLRNKIIGIAKKYRSFEIAEKIYDEIYG